MRHSVYCLQVKSASKLRTTSCGERVGSYSVQDPLSMPSDKRSAHCQMRFCSVFVTRIFQSRWLAGMRYFVQHV